MCVCVCVPVCLLKVFEFTCVEEDSSHCRLSAALSITLNLPRQAPWAGLLTNSTPQPFVVPINGCRKWWPRQSLRLLSLLPLFRFRLPRLPLISQLAARKLPAPVYGFITPRSPSTSLWTLWSAALEVPEHFIMYLHWLSLTFQIPIRHHLQISIRFNRELLIYSVHITLTAHFDCRRIAM